MLGTKLQSNSFKILGLVLTCLSTSTVSPLMAKVDGEQAKKYIILSSFKSNKKIWGTYNQIFEAGYKVNQKGKKVKKNKAKLPLANIIFKDGKLFLIRPSKKNNAIDFQVLDMPYRRIRKGTYAIDPTNHKDQLYSIFENHLNEMIKKGFYEREKISSLKREQIIFKQITCSKQRRIFHCEFPVEFDL